MGGLGQEGRTNIQYVQSLGPQNGICDELFPTFEKEETYY